MTKLTEEIQKVIDNTSDVLYREEIYINGRHEYDYHKLDASLDATVHTLYYSDDFEWTDVLKKQIAMQLIDTGNGIQLIGVSKKELNYLQAEHLHILLRLASQKCTYQIVEPSPKKEF